MVFKFKILWVLCFTCFVFALCAGCSNKNVPVKSVNSELPADELWHLGLEKADARDYAGALSEISLAQKKDPQIKYELAVAHLQFLDKNYKAALKGYKKLINSGKLNSAQKESLATEVARIESSNGDVTGRSVAGQWVRAIVAVVAAEEALANKNYTAAYKEYDKAYQYNSDYTLLLESALAASVAEQWDWAYKKYKEYLAVGGDDIGRDMQYRIIAETDRIMALMKGKQVVTLKSLADEVYAERSGEEAADGLPPSMSGDTDDIDGDGNMADATGEPVVDSDAPDSDGVVAASASEDGAVSGDVAGEKTATDQISEQAEVGAGQVEAARHEAEALREAAKAEKQRDQETAALQAKLARERRLALKKERADKKKAAQEAKRQREIERKAALKAKAEAEKQRRVEEKARKEAEKRRRAEERRLEKEARAREREIARQEAEAARLEKEAEQEAEKAKREAAQEKLEEEKRIAAEAAQQQAEAKRAAAMAARQQAVAERKRLKEERKLAQLAKVAEKKRQREEAKRQRAEARQRKADERKREAAERKALAEQKKRERQEEKRIAAEQKRAELAEKRAEKAKKKAERALARQARELEKAQKSDKAAVIAERETASKATNTKEAPTDTIAPRAGDATTKGNVAASGTDVPLRASDQSARTVETTFDDLLFYAESKSATVRFRAVKELIPIVNERSRIALENRVISDRNIHVRFLAVGGLAERDSKKSLPVLEHALITAATSQERAVLKKAISVIRLGVD